MSARMKKRQPKKGRAKAKIPVQPDKLKGWTEIAQFLGQPLAVAQR